MEFKQILKRIMQEQSLSQGDVANMSGVTQTIVSRWLRTDLTPRIEQLQKLAESLKIPVASLIADSQTAINQADLEFQRLTQSEKELALDVIRLISKNYAPKGD